MNKEIELSLNLLVRELKKPAEEFTMSDIIDYVKAHDVKMINFMYPAEDNADGANRFNYNGRTDLMVETTVIDSIQYLKQNSDKIIQEVISYSFGGIILGKGIKKVR